MAKIQNFDSFGGCIPTFHVYRGNESPLRGENLFLDHGVKTIPAWLRFMQACG